MVPRFGLQPDTTETFDCNLVRHLPYWKYCKSIFSKIWTCSVYNRANDELKNSLLGARRLEAYPRSKIDISKRCQNLHCACLIKGMVDKWPKYSGHFLANSNLADAEAKLPLQAQRHTKKDNNLCVFFFLLKRFWMPVSQHLCMYSRIKGRPFQITFYPVYMNLIGWNLCRPSES